jgi:cytochrome c-type biogenesis protein CcmF
LVAGALAAAVAALAGMREPGHLALTALAGLALAVNAVMTVRLFRRGWAYGAGYLGHVGIAVMVIGMVVSSSLGRSERLRLVEGQPAQALGYTLTYHGEQADPRGQHMLMVRVEKPGWSFDARPRLFPSPQGEGTIRKPALAQRGELYLSPMEVVAPPSPADGPTWLDKGQELELAGVGYTFSGFRMVSEKGLTVFADIQVRKDGRSVTVAPALQVGAGGNQPVDAQVDGLGALSLAKIDADHGRVAVRLPAASAARSMALVELSTKPLINLVWIGALLALVGSVLAGLHRAAEKAPARTAPRRAARNRQEHPTPRTVQRA